MQKLSHSRDGQVPDLQLEYQDRLCVQLADITCCHQHVLMPGPGQCGHRLDGRAVQESSIGGADEESSGLGNCQG